MGGHIPHSIRTKVIVSWIDGISRDEIASQNGIATGTVSKIIKHDGSQIVDIDLLRTLSKQLRKDDVTTIRFASGVRLVNRLNRLGMSLEDMDSAVELLDVNCFKTGQTVVELIHKVDEATKIALDLGVTLDELSKHLIDQLDEKNGLQSQIATLRNTLSEEFRKFDTTKIDLEDYSRNRHKLDEFRDLQNKLKEKEQLLEKIKIKLQEHSYLEEGMEAGMRKHVEREIEKFNKEFDTDKPLDIEEFEKIMGELHYTPCKYPKIIQLLRHVVSSADENDMAV